MIGLAASDLLDGGGDALTVARAYESRPDLVTAIERAQDRILHTPSIRIGGVDGVQKLFPTKLKR